MIKKKSLYRICLAKFQDAIKKKLLIKKWQKEFAISESQVIDFLSFKNKKIS